MQKALKVRMKKPQMKWIIFGAIIVVVAGLGVTAAVLFSQYQASIQPTGDKKPGTITPRPVVEKKANDAIKKAYEGDVAGGVAEIDQAVRDTNDSFEKYTLYSHKATLLYNSGDVAGGLEAALMAYKFKQSSDSAALVAQFSRESGNKEQAIQYYKRAVELVDKTDPYANEDAEYYGAMVKEIESGA